MSNQTLDQSTESAVLINPFPGLRPFEFHESHLFFGRDGQSEQLIAKLAATRFLAVVGTSGSGKSSLVRAGLLPALYSGFMSSAGSGWRMAVMRPGNDPLGNLAQALNEPGVFGSDDEANRALQIAITEATLRRGSRGLVEAVQQANLPATENLLVVADQLEELFRVERSAQESEQENDRAAFVKLLLEARQRREEGPNIYVVLTMRSDYLGDCAQFWDLPEAINEGQYLIPRLTREQRREAITGPIFVGGAEATPRLINRLLNDVGDNPDQLPILQHALMRTWDEWQEKRLKVKVDGVERWHREAHAGEAIDLCCYEAIGGMADALSNHANEVFKKLSARRRLIAKKIFQSLTGKDKDNRETRHPVKFGDLCKVAEESNKEVKKVIETFSRRDRSFLMPSAGTKLTDDTLIDISHESLIRVWGRLKKWINEESESAALYLRLVEAAKRRQPNGAKRRREYWRGEDLAEALDWRKEFQPNDSWACRYDEAFDLAMRFLDESLKEPDRFLTSEATVASEVATVGNKVATVALLAQIQIPIDKAETLLQIEGVDAISYKWVHTLRELTLPQKINEAVIIVSTPGIFAIGERTKEARLQVGNKTHLLVCTPLLTEGDRLTLSKYGADTIITPRTYAPEHIAERITAELILQGIVQPSSFGFLRGATRNMRRLYSDIETLAELSEPILILGETGTGKELIAREIHRRSKRPEPFLKLNCAEFLPELFGSELFGHAKGSFTGAHQAKAGLMGEAGKGTLFLDGIGELTLQAQAMLLQVLEDRKFRAIGSNMLMDFNARLVLATHRNLEQMVDEGKFRHDLFVRIYDFTLHAPPLRERRADIPLLVHHFIEAFNREYPDRKVGIPAGALDCLFQSEWPENVRQLRKVVWNAAVFSDSNGNISKVHLQKGVDILNQRKELNEQYSASFDPASDTFHNATRRIQKAYLKALLDDTKGNNDTAIKRSGLSRSRFYTLLKELEIK